MSNMYILKTNGITSEKESLWEMVLVYSGVQENKWETKALCPGVPWNSRNIIKKTKRFLIF